MQHRASGRKAFREEANGTIWLEFPAELRQALQSLGKGPCAASTTHVEGTLRVPSGLMHNFNGLRNLPATFSRQILDIPTATCLY
jgi:hypothetical protein